MDIVLIGTGNVATVLGKMLKNAGHSILQVVGRNIISAQKLALELNSDYTDSLDKINVNASVYLIVVNDTSITELASKLRLPSKIVAHTGGTVSMESLSPISEHYAVFYPLQSLKKEIIDLPIVPILIEGCDEKTISVMTELAESISPNNVSLVNEADRMKLHVAAVLVNNFVNHLYILSEDFCQKEGLDFSLLKPLIAETAERIIDGSANLNQTGPAKRNDFTTLERHLQLLQHHPDIKSVYELMTKSIQLKNH